MVISLQAQQSVGWLKRVAERVEYIKTIGFYPTDLAAKLIGRVYMDEAQQNEFIASGDAQGYWEAIRAEVEANPGVYIWEGPNEPSIWIEAVRNGFEQFTQDLIRIFHERGLRIIVGNLNVGHPDVDDEDLLHLIGRAIQGADGLGLHEYNWPNLWDGEDPDNPPEQNGQWYTLRYRRLVAWLRAHGYEVPPLFTTELGLDEAVVPGHEHRGWVGHLTVEQYARQIAWYESEARKDGVRAALLFIAGPFQDWESFRVTEELMERVFEEIEALPPEPAPGERARGLYVSEYQRGIDWAQIHGEYDYVLIRVSAGLHADPLFAEHWRQAAGMPRGVWHYLTASDDGQASFVADQVGERRPELGYWADLEEADLTGERCMRFLEAADGQCGEMVGVYTNPSFAQRLPAEVGQRRLWLAHWTHDPSAPPTVPPQWPEWTFWQWDNESYVGEVRVCPDLYRGTRAEMYREFDISEEVTTVRIYDNEGQERDWAWLRERYGNVRVHETAFHSDNETFKLVELREKIGPASCVVRVLDEHGAPVHRAVAQGWRDGEQLPDDMDPLNGLPQGYPNKGDAAFPNENGDVGFGWGGGEYYDPATQEGAHYYWVCAFYSDVLTGVGMLMETEHAHMEPVFQRVVEEPEPGPGPEPSPSEWVRVAIIGTVRVEQVVLLTPELERCLGM